jgi:hypothetical protein
MKGRFSMETSLLLGISILMTMWTLFKDYKQRKRVNALKQRNMELELERLNQQRQKVTEGMVTCK